ncbi:MAG TPA: N-formylglutamate amidohydrolase [Cytophagales bacterium]|nr:N-formylglutamate amidohydrolase [Cytophagales bacterium]
MVKFIISCEHGGNKIPQEYNPLFKNAEDVLATHRGWDVGILPVAQEIAEILNLDITYSTTSRLLVELNRSIGKPDLFSSYTHSLSLAEKERILNEYYFPYRNKIEMEIRKSINSGSKVIHLSFHSFTPVLNGIERQADMGLLFDPEREMEAKFCEQWKETLQVANRDYNVMFNYPYLGTDDGFTTYLRTQFPKDMYGGIELEVNQKFLTDQKKSTIMTQSIKKSLQMTINQSGNLI